MAKYHPIIPPEALEAYLIKRIDDPRERLAVEVEILFGEAQQWAGDRFRRQITPKPLLHELEDPRWQGEDDR